MSMSQTEWSRRVAEIGALDPTDPMFASEWANEYPPDFLKFHDMEWPRNPPAMARAIRQLAADWLAAEGVVAVRVCRWTFANGAWGSGCGRHWTLPGDLSEMCFSCCPRCGGKIEVAP